ncbi:MAG: sensor histidine kinase, partial [Pseudomonadota bacterium]
MGFDQRFTIGLLAWIALLGVALLACVEAFATPGLAAARLVAVGLAAGMFAGLWRHVTRTNRTLARFLEAVKFGDTAVRFDGHGGAGFSELAQSLNEVLGRFRAEQDRAAGEARYLDALVDDIPVAVLTVSAEDQVAFANKAARRLFKGEMGTRPEDFAHYSATFARRLADSV